jgi:hypothetical protein
MLVRLLERRASAVRGDAFATEPDRHFVRLGIRAFYPTLRVRLVEADVVDHLALLVVEPAQERSRAEQATEAAVGKSRKCVC